MKAFILAGGLGTRLKPRFGELPKSLAPLGGRPFLERQLEWLASHGVRDAVILAGYGADALEHAIGDGAKFGMRVEWSIESEPLATWQRMIDLNLTSCFIGTKLIGAAMLERGNGGRIINIASISALIANRGIGGRDYETSKAAVLHFTRCAAADWAPHGITVNAICPGLFMTDINREWNERRPEVIEAFVQNVPMGRTGEPDEIGPLAVYLASPAAAYVTGAAYVIDGGYTLW